MVAEREHIDVTQAFTRLRSHARNHNLRLADVATHVVHGTIDISALDPPSA